MVLFYAAYSWLMGVLNAFRGYLWMAGMLSSRGRGETLRYLVFRGSQPVLILALRSILAIPAPMFLGAVAQLAYYLRLARPARPSLELLRRGWRRLVASGVQYWLASYIGSAGANVLSFAVFAALSVEASGLLAFAGGLAAAYLVKPLPGSAVEQLPPWARRFALPFSR